MGRCVSHWRYWIQISQSTFEDMRKLWQVAPCTCDFDARAGDWHSFKPSTVACELRPVEQSPYFGEQEMLYTPKYGDTAKRPSPHILGSVQRTPKYGERSSHLLDRKCALVQSAAAATTRNNLRCTHAILQQYPAAPQAAPRRTACMSNGDACHAACASTHYGVPISERRYLASEKHC
jgi:hypothetical protein